MDANHLIKVSSIQNICIHDGNGIRTTVFLKGCFLHCPWCCNPETISTDINYFYNPEKCLKEKQIISALCTDCEIKGGSRPKEQCKFGAYKPTCKNYTTDDLLKVLLRDQYLYEESNGGITFSGGEPFLQASNIKELLQQLKQRNINVAFETSLFCPHNSFNALLPYIDTFFIDLKLQFGFIINKTINNDYSNEFLQNLRLLQRQKDKQLIYRYVFIPEALKDSRSQELFIANLLELNVGHLEILPYHTLARKKYEQVNVIFHEFKTPTPTDISSLTTLLESNNVNYTILKY